jgi:hypothetical protein
MSNHIDVHQNNDHIGGNFEWAVEPSCCSLLKDAVDEERFIFVSNFVDKKGGPNTFYMLPVTSDGHLARSDGVQISHCPWCGTKIDARKQYPSE